MKVNTKVYDLRCKRYRLQVSKNNKEKEKETKVWRK